MRHDLRVRLSLSLPRLETSSSELCIKSTDIACVHSVVGSTTLHLKALKHCLFLFFWWGTDLLCREVLAGLASCSSDTALRGDWAWRKATAGHGR